MYSKVGSKCKIVGRFYEIKAIFFIKIKTLSLVLQKVPRKMSVKLYKYLSAVREYHYYRNYWLQEMGEELDCMQERYDFFYLSAIKGIKETTGKTVSHLSIENLRVTKYLIDRGVRFIIVLIS